MKVQSQNYYDIYKSFDFSRSYKNLKESTDSLIIIARNNESYNDIAKISKHFSLKAYRNNYDEAIYYSKMSYKNKELINEVDKEYVGAIYRVGYFYLKKRDFKSAILFFEKCIEIDINKRVSGQALCEIGKCYFELNDYYRSINYYKRGIPILEEVKEYAILEREYKNISLVYDELDTKNSLLSKLDILKRADSLEKNHRNSLTQRLKINNSYVTLYSRDKMYNYDKAVYFAKQNLELASKNNQPIYICTSYVNLANLCNKEMNDSTLYYAEKSKKFCKRTIAKSTNDYAISEYYYNKKDYNSALIYNQKAINAFLDSTKQKQTFNSVPLLKDLNELNEKDYIIKVINDKSKLLNNLSKNKNTLNFSNLALQHVLVADSLVDIIQSETNNTAKLHWRLKASEIYTQGIEICSDLNKPDTAFYLSEKGKALLLTEDILNNNALTKLPDSIKIKEEMLKKEVYSYYSIKDKKIEAELEYDAFMDSIKATFPNYFKNKALQQVITLSELQKKLNDDVIVLSYIWPNSEISSDTVYGLFISKNSKKLIKIGNLNDINKLLKKYLEYIRKPLKTKQDRTKFNNIAFQLYSKLLQPKNINLNYKDIIILPDGNLHNIPFEALTTSKSSLDYLIYKHNISYSYSMSFLEHNKSIKRITKNNFIGFAPQNFDSLDLSSLDNSILEINTISSITNGAVYTNGAATKSSFLKNTNETKIIHLATHADAKDNPWIAFNDSRLSLQELYTFKNNAELTVLSSCDTSLGEIATGEGVMSLARGFFYSGSNSVVASLWNVNDKSTSFLMKDFYKNLKNRESKSKALRTAKLNYIDSHSLSETSPYYWSSFILLGDTDVINLESDFTTLHYIILGFILLLSIFLFFRFKKK